MLLAVEAEGDAAAVACRVRGEVGGEVVRADGDVVVIVVDSIAVVGEDEGVTTLT